MNTFEEDLAKLTRAKCKVSILIDGVPDDKKEELLDAIDELCRARAWVSGWTEEH